MLRTLSYFNLVLAAFYFIMYTSNGGTYALAGNVLMLVFNGATLVQLQKERYTWNAVQYISVLPAVWFILFLLYSSIHLVRSAIGYHYLGKDLLLLIILNMILGLTGFFQFLLICKRHEFHLSDKTDR